MQELLHFFSYPFMQRALVAGLFLGILLSLLGVFAVMRRMAFFGEGIAHASLAGIALAIFFHADPLPVALAWSVFIAVAIWYVERKARLPSDSAIGLLFTASMALGVTLMSQTEGYQPDLLSYLFGSILAVRSEDLLLVCGMSVILLAWLFVKKRDLMLSSFSEDVARLRGVSVDRLTLCLSIALAIAAVLGARILGILLVSALLILPPATSSLFARSFASHLLFSFVFSVVFVIAGLIASIAFSIPSGAAIVLVGTLCFLIGHLFRLVHPR